MSHLRSTWAKRVTGAAALWLVVCGIAIAGQMRPRPLLLGALVAAVALAWWLVQDLPVAVRSAAWQPLDPPAAPQRGADARLTRLYRTLAEATASRASTPRLHAALVELADERLRLAHGVDRGTDPGRARALLGPDLDRFVTHPPPERRPLDPAYLSALLTRIESL